jgi:hypothetical protein
MCIDFLEDNAPELNAQNFKIQIAALSTPLGPWMYEFAIHGVSFVRSFQC